MPPRIAILHKADVFDHCMLSFMVCMHVFRTVYAVYETPTLGEGDHFSCIASAKSLGLLEGSHNLSSSSRI